MTRYLLAVSGGVDSVVLLDKMAQSPDNEIIVAHFDHGMRPESREDARFVRLLAKRYGKQFVSQRVELGADANEATARHYRYKFLRAMAKQYQARIVTAHHRDDLIETIAINLVRGTGWRGLAVFGDQAIYRPLLATPKHEIYTYALRHKLEWVEDETNSSDAYLRNRLRKTLGRLDQEQVSRLVALWRRQRQLHLDIKSETASVLGRDQDSYSRYFFTMIDENAAIEILRALTSGIATRPQLRRGVLAIKTAQSGKTIVMNSRLRLTFTKRTFIVETL